MKSIPAIKGVAENLRTFEQDMYYISVSKVGVDDDGYVRSGKELKKDDYDEPILVKGAIVPISEDEHIIEEYGERFETYADIYVRVKSQDISFDIKVGDFFKIENDEWRILNIRDHDEVLMCSCGKLEEESYESIG